MSNEEKLQKIRETITGDVFTVLKVNNINHNPHPYILGPKHVCYGADHNGGRLDESVCRKVQCAFPNCNLPYDQHTSDNVCFLQLKRNATQSETQAILKDLVEKLGENFVDGFVFVDTDEKYRIT